MSRIILGVSTFCFLVLSQTSFAEASYELEHKRKGSVVVDEQSTQEIDLPFLDTYETKEFLCYKTVKGEPKYEFEVIEYQLELGILIQHLESLGEEAMLTRTQRIFISKIPFCSYFEKELRVVSLLLKGYTLVSE